MKEGKGREERERREDKKWPTSFNKKPTSAIRNTLG